MEEKQLDFRYVELIRKPQIKEIDNDSNCGKSNSENIICVALDYFDVIYAKRVPNLEKCMISENDIPCEAYQSLSLFREEQGKMEEDPFQVNQEYPFFALMQVTVTPEVYQKVKEGEEFDQKLLEDELNEVVSEVKKIFESNDQVIKLKYQIYHTINTMDFCIVLSSDRMDFSSCLSTRIKARVCGPTGQEDPKYAVYTVMGIYHQFAPERNRTYMQRDTILVARILLDRELYVKKKLREEFKAILRAEEGKRDISTHSLLGRYELTVRLDGDKNILEILNTILSYIMCSFTEGKEKTNDQSINLSSDQNGDNVLQWLMKKRMAKYLNIRIFFNTFNCFAIDAEQDSLLIKNTRKPHEEVEEAFEKLHEYADEQGALRKLDDYFHKLHHMIHTYVTLYPQYDTNINIKMLGDCLIDFIGLLKLHIGFVSEGNESIEDVEKNVLWALNYFQQYVRVISSVNSNSFQSPQYEIEKDECSIVKLPIAYMQFLQEMFSRYYEFKKALNDNESAYFPKYVPLVIPYMQNSSYDSDFMMLTLLGQNMADDWNAVKDQWSSHIENGRVLIFIICQNMKKYKSASELIVSAFHEMGHYCNGLTREVRNRDLIDVLSEEVAKSLAKRAVSKSGVSYLQMVAALNTSPVIICLYKCIFCGISSYFRRELEAYMQFPKDVFLEKLWESLRKLTNEFVDCENTQAYCDRFFDDYLDDIAFYIGFRCGKESLEDKLQEAGAHLKQKFREMTVEVNACLSAISNVELTEKTQRYLNLANEIIDSVFDEDNGNDDSNEIEMINEKSNRLIGYACELAGYVRDYENADVTKLRNLLKTGKQLVALCLQFKDDTAFKKAVAENKQWENSAELKILAEKRGKLLEEIRKNYLDDLPLAMTSEPIEFLELYCKMYISEENSLNEFKRYFNEVISGASVSEAVLELAKSNYEESIADVVMCVNLGLELRHYLAFVFDMYEKGDNKFRQSVPRFAIVISYLLYVKGRDKSQDKEELLKRIDQNLIKDFQEYLKDDIKKMKSACGELCEIMQKEFINVQRSKLFRTAFCRVIQLGDRVKFVDSTEEFKEIQDFVKRSLEIKLNDNIDNTVIQMIQRDELEFILKLYYRNRVQYAKKDKCTKEGSSDGLESTI